MYHAIWRRKDGDRLVTIKEYLGQCDDRHYVSIEDSFTGIPLDELCDVDNPYVGFWVDNHGRINFTE